MDNTMPELKNIIEMIYRYNTLHKEGCFIFNFIGWKKDPNHKCVDCGDNCDEIDENKSILGAYGNIEDLREMLNGLRDIVEDNSNEDGFVCI